MFSRLHTNLLGALSLVAAMPMAAPTYLGVPRADPRERNRSRSRYAPHQGKREIARRLRQAERLAQKGN